MSATEAELDRVLEQMCDSANGNLFSFLEKKANKCIREGVRQFYASYSPKHYSRTYSLGSMAKPVITNNSFELKLGAEFSEGGHHVSEDEIYETVFEEGYHGGAKYGAGHPAPGRPYWRTPYPELTHWGRPAVQSMPPYKAIVNNWNNVIDSELEPQKAKILEIVQKVFTPRIQKIIIDMLTEELQK